MKVKTVIGLGMSILFLSNPIVAFADTDRLDVAMLAAIVEMFRYASFVTLIIGIGLLILSAKNESGLARSTGIKFLGATVALFLIKTVASLAGLI